MKARKQEPFFYFAAGDDFAVFIAGVRDETALVPVFMSMRIIVNNNPVSWTDPLCLDCDDCGRECASKTWRMRPMGSSTQTVFLAWGSAEMMVTFECEGDEFRRVDGTLECDCGGVGFDLGYDAVFSLNNRFNAMISGKCPEDLKGQKVGTWTLALPIVSLSGDTIMAGLSLSLGYYECTCEIIIK